jgi:hypothetical protein
MSVNSRTISRLVASSLSHRQAAGRLLDVLPNRAPFFPIRAMKRFIESAQRRSDFGGPVSNLDALQCVPPVGTRSMFLARIYASSAVRSCFFRA